MSPRPAIRLFMLLVPALLVAPVDAHAEKVVTDDAVADAHKVNWDRADVTDPPFLVAPEETSTDITRTVVAHGERRLSVTVHFRDLVRITDHTTFLQVHTPNRGAFAIDLSKEEGSRAELSMSTRKGAVECLDLRGAIDRVGDAVRLSVPTACLGQPRWVQLGVGAIGATVPDEGQDPSDFELFADDGHRPTFSNQRPTRGPRVRRG